MFVERGFPFWDKIHSSRGAVSQEDYKKVYRTDPSDPKSNCFNLYKEKIWIDFFKKQDVKKRMEELVDRFEQETNFPKAKKIYIKLSKYFHPDRNKEGTEEIMKRINNIFDKKKGKKQCTK